MWYTPEWSATKFLQHRIKTAEQRRGRRQAEYGDNDVHCWGRIKYTRQNRGMLWLLTCNVMNSTHQGRGRKST